MRNPYPGTFVIDRIVENLNGTFFWGNIIGTFNFYQ